MRGVMLGNGFSTHSAKSWSCAVIETFTIYTYQREKDNFSIITNTDKET